jgi:hypothetical protein
LLVPQATTTNESANTAMKSNIFFILSTSCSLFVPVFI